ncbi:MAG: membrane-bound PQQ-dependent dehydrogenase, glucose/quinate/shikimate family [Burkholderiaceae bacterium]
MLARKIYAVLLAVVAVFLVAMGARLALIGGSPYYVLIGLVYAASAVMMWKGSARAVHLLGFALLATLVWALYEVGTAYWGLFPRLLVPLGLFFVGAFLCPAGKPTRIWGVVGLVAFAAFFARAFLVVPEVSYQKSADYKAAKSDNAPLDWTAYSRDTFGVRYSPFTQINRGNVKDLQLAWTYRTGRDLTSNANAMDQNTPLQIGNTLYACTPENAVHAINATTGQREWLFEAKASTYAWARCRGLGYYKDKDNKGEAAAGEKACRARIIGNTVDGRLFALDAKTGTPCADFGNQGVVNLRGDSMGPVGPGYYYQTSAPLVAGDRIVVGGWISDNQKIGEPAGAVRAFDVHSGALVWAWDPGDPEVGKDPVNGGTYTLGTPNMWSHAAYDPALGLIYAPMGNAGTDYYNADRPKHSLKYNAALVAIDAGTGKPKWSFQTTHDDLWDYDIPSQPALLDMKNDQGQMVPAVLAFTKRGQIFALDRRSGEPIAKVEERPVPTSGGIPENTISPTQPYSTGMPHIGVQHRLTEASSWGMTMFDQLMCRISFKQLRYDGDFTQPGLDWSLSMPGALGGLNWGSASYDPENRRLFVNDIRLTNTRRLIKRDEYEAIAKLRKPTPDGHGLAPMEGTPYGVLTGGWMSELGVPCIQPPMGTVTAIDLDSRKIAWQVPAGTAQELGPLGIKLGLPLTLGMPTYAGTSTTAGGLVFFAGTQDYYLRAYDAETGEELWRFALPVGASATPMSYVSPVDQRQYVLISVGGAARSKAVGDYVMAFALPKRP